MSSNDENNDELVEFVDSAAPAIETSPTSFWRVLIVDDEKDVHSATTFAMRNTEVIGRPLKFLHASSSSEACHILTTVKDIAVIMLDVVMETPNAGLDLVDVIRNELGIKDSRIILRTGQPNQAPEIDVIRDYDINDYKLKSELTQSRLFASLTTAVRTYKQIHMIEAGRRGLGIIVKSSAELLTQKGVNEFAEGVIVHLSGLLSIKPEGLICVRRHGNYESGKAHIIAAAGHYTKLIDCPLDELVEETARRALSTCIDSRRNSYEGHGIALYLGSAERGDMACFVSSIDAFAEVDEKLLEIFCSNITICADNLELVKRLSQYAYYDVLIGLPNRNALVEEIDRSLHCGTSAEYSLSMVDIDNFAEINASLGQEYGDKLLKSVGKRIEHYFPMPCVVARVAGDTFAVFGPSATIDQKRLLAPFEKPFDIGSEEQIISVTAGIVPLAETRGSGDEAVKDASIVLKTAKNHSRGEVVLFKHDMVKDAHDRLGMLRHLRAGFELGQLFMVYQPKLRLADKVVTGFEALVRWRDQSGNLISPENFIPLAEQSGLIIRLGTWILQASLETLRGLHEQGWSHCHMSVNLSVAQLQHPDFLTTLKDSVEHAGVDPRFVDLEITESLAVTDIDTTLEQLNKIKAMGFTLSLDDFGTGFSSLNYLQKMPIDYLKLDKTLIDAIASQSGKEVVEMILHLAERLSLEVVAEGVEKRSQVAFLEQLNCSYAQGFYYAKPLEKDALNLWLSKANGAL